MEKNEIREYRKVLEKEFSDKDMEIETAIGYISVAALGFFITINDKFISIDTAKHKWILVASLIFLVASFILVLYRKFKANCDDLSLMDTIDCMLENSREDEVKLYDQWQKSHKILRKILFAIFMSLSIGLVLQVIFFVLNLSKH